MEHGSVINIGPGNGLSPVRSQAITTDNADLSSIRPFGTYYSENSTEIETSVMVSVDHWGADSYIIIKV